MAEILLGLGDGHQGTAADLYGLQYLSKFIAS